MIRKIIGFIFILSSFVGLVRYGFINFIICLLIGICLLYNSKSKRPVSSEKPVLTGDKRTKSVSFPVAGVTFNNESGKLISRQTILRKIYFSDSPFDQSQSVSLDRYFFENKPAYYVKVNNIIIGNVPAEFVRILDENLDREYSIEDFHVNANGKGKNYGAELKVLYTDSLNA